ncbi:hypothetical protein DYB37_000455 [Aphanomyces astaci]|uniref:Glycoside hydrolase family 5 domain-containing protein n=1 Tax=Aphanomyces astaci TaxID=112090 RepID=A0A418EXA4_APHAT|nr:hypothetical protein DYB37_000455 [Aphanomyces astaci]
MGKHKKGVEDADGGAESVFTPQLGADDMPDHFDSVPIFSPRQSTVRESIMSQFPVSELKYKENPKTFRGRIRTWPGVLLALALLALTAVLVTYFAIDSHNTKQALVAAVQKRKFQANTIGGGDTTPPGDVLVDADDGVMGNPKVYPVQQCELPNYISKSNKIFSVSSTGVEVPVAIKGINWGDAIPFGLWANDQNGTTAYQIASFLSANKFNSVRLPVSVYNILNNVKPKQSMINVAANRAFDVSSYVALLKSVITTLAYRKISVMISIHTLTPQSSGGSWFNNDISKDMVVFLSSIDMLTTELCHAKYWNIIGVDLKNEPYESTWGDSGPMDFHQGATIIGNRMLKGCPQWLAFVEGIVTAHEVDIAGDTFSYYDWWGGGLQRAKDFPVQLSIPNKVVYAPHYYNPAVYPQSYFFDKGGVVRSNGAMIGYKELPDSVLRQRVAATMDTMFGFLTKTQDAAVVLGEFGGLYALDLHPLKTTQRCTDYTVQEIMRPGYVGGYVWSMNPESAYQFNPSDVRGNFVEGVLNLDWLSANKDFLAALKPLDQMADLKMFPCFEKEAL